MKRTDLAWAAGLIDGEGCIYAQRHGTIRLSISMCDVECLHRFRRLLGGHLTPWIEKPGRRSFRTINLFGRDALRAIRLMTPWLSSVKLADYHHAKQIAPNAGRGANWIKKHRTHCPHGHRFSLKNTFWMMGKHGRQRICRACRRRVNAAWYQRNRYTRFWRKYRRAS